MCRPSVGVAVVIWPTASRLVRRGARCSTCRRCVWSCPSIDLSGGAALADMSRPQRSRPVFGAPTQYGSGIRALGVYLVAAQHLPYQRAAQLLGDWLGALLSPATLVAFVKDAAGDLDEFLDLVHERIVCSPVVHFDETGARVAGRGRWLHCASTETLTFYALHDRRGTEGIDHAGVMPRFRGIAVHDGWPQYRSYTEVTHALCNAHHLRELMGVIEQHTDNRQSWAKHMDALLRALHEEVKDAKAAGED
jgi:transposase